MASQESFTPHQGLFDIYQKTILTIPKIFRKIFCGLTRQKVNFLEGFTSHCIWHKTNTFFTISQNIIPTVKHDVGVEMVWGCFAA